jgi:hypothetical protein
MTVLPIVLPRVIVTVYESGDAQVTVDGLERPEGPVDRGQLGSVLASIAEAADGPVRVEVRESDGTCYADILQPQRRRAPCEEKCAGLPAGVPVLRARGFAPGETVLVAVLAMSIRADADGTVCLLAAPKRPRCLDELILLGSVSRRTVRGRRILPAKSGRWWR